MEEKKSLKERFKEFWADKERRNTVLCLGGTAVTIISAYIMGYKIGGADMKIACDIASDITKAKASSDGVLNGMNCAAVLHHLGYPTSNYEDVFSNETGEVMGIKATTPDGKLFFIGPAGVNENGEPIHGWKLLSSQK